MGAATAASGTGVGSTGAGMGSVFGGDEPGWGTPFVAGLVADAGTELGRTGGGAAAVAAAAPSCVDAGGMADGGADKPAPLSIGCDAAYMTFAGGWAGAGGCGCAGGGCTTCTWPVG